MARNLKLHKHLANPKSQLAKAITASAAKCERCGYNEADPEVAVPDFVQDRYSSICADCESELYRKQARMEG